MSNLPDRIVLVFFGFFILAALGKMIFESPFSNFIVIPFGTEPGEIRVHTLTVFLISVTFLFFWAKVLHYAPFFPRILLAVTFCYIGYVAYDFFWVVGCSFNATQIVIPADPFGWFQLNVYVSLEIEKTLLLQSFWAGIPLAVLVFFKVWKPKYLPKIPIKRFFLVLGLNFLLILWLESTGFYSHYWRYWFARRWFDLIYPDPHGWVWFIGKALGMLSFPFIFIDFRKIKTKLLGVKKA